MYFVAVLLLAYMKGNANLCRAIVRAGARLGVTNNQGINIFNYQVATKQLLFRLLGIFFIPNYPSIFQYYKPTASQGIACCGDLWDNFRPLLPPFPQICFPKSPRGVMAPTAMNAVPSLELQHGNITG